MKRGRAIVVAGLALALSACRGAVEEGATAWTEGDRARAQQVWLEASEAGRPSSALLYDLGLAWYDNGDRVRAIGAWRAARFLAPRDGDAATNLARARGALTGVPEPAAPPAAWMEFVTPIELGLVAIAALAAGSTGLWWRRMRNPAAARTPFVAVWAFGLLLGIMAVRANVDLIREPVAVVQLDLPARDAPLPEAGVQFSLPPGSEVVVEAESGAFALVRTGEGRRGWVAAEGLLVLSP